MLTVVESLVACLDRDLGRIVDAEDALPHVVQKVLHV